MATAAARDSARRVAVSSCLRSLASSSSRRDKRWSTLPTMCFCSDKHELISYGATLAFQQVASMIPETIPVILESIVSAEFIDDEIEAAHEALATGGPRPRVRKRRSGATIWIGVTSGLTCFL